MQLDLKDKRILHCLDQNSRMSYSQIAKAVHLSQETVRYRVNNLAKRKIINKFFTIIDSSKLSYAFYKVLIKLHNVDENKIQEIKDFLNKNPHITWLVRIDGTYDLGLTIKVSNIIDLNNLLDNLNAEFHKFINKKKISVNILGEYLVRDYLIDKKRSLKRQTSYSTQFNQLKIDDIDKSIIKLLAEDSRIFSTEIAKKIEISADSVLQRIKSLEKNKVITGYNIVINHQNINQIHYKVLVYLNHVSKEKINSFTEYCRKNNHIIYIIKSLGEWDYELDIEVANINEFRNIMMDMTKEFHEIIKNYDSLIISEIYKYNLYP